MASLIAILDLKGKPLIQRSYRDDVPATYIEKFLPIILDLEEEGQQVTPCFSREGVNYMHIRHSNLYSAFCHILLWFVDGVKVLTYFWCKFIFVAASTRTLETQHECRGDHPVHAQTRAGPRRILQGARGRIYPRQLCHHIRAHGRDDGLRFPADDRKQDLARVSTRSLFVVAVYLCGGSLREMLLALYAGM